MTDYPNISDYCRVKVADSSRAGLNAKVFYYFGYHFCLLLSKFGGVIAFLLRGCALLERISFALTFVVDNSEEADFSTGFPFCQLQHLPQTS